MINRVLLLSPFYSSVYGSFKPALKAGFLNPPIGLCYIASSLQKNGYEVFIIDAESEDTSLDKLVRDALTLNPDIIGITATSPVFRSALEISRSFKKLSSVPIVLGGPHITIMRNQVLEGYPEFDFGVVGEGEETMIELLRAIACGQDLSNVQGLIYRDGSNRVTGTQERTVLRDIDSRPFPARTIIHNERYTRSVPGKGIVKAAAVMSSRGCPFQCIYCAIKKIPGGNHIRMRSAKNVIDEIEDIVKKLGIRHITFNDDDLTISRSRTMEMCEEIIKRKLDITWEGLTRATLVDRELFQIMRKAGFVRVSFGIESGNPEILKGLNRNVTLEDVEKAIEMAKEAGIVTRGSIMIGLPNDTRKTVHETLNYVCRLKSLDQVIINITTPYPGTVLEEMAKKGEGGMRLLSEDVEELRRFGNAVIEVNDLTKQDLINLQKVGLLRFYLSSPKRIFRNLTEAGFKSAIVNSYAFVRSILK